MAGRDDRKSLNNQADFKLGVDNVIFSVDTQQNRLMVLLVMRQREPYLDLVAGCNPNSAYTTLAAGGSFGHAVGTFNSCAFFCRTLAYRPSAIDIDRLPGHECGGRR